MGRYVVGFSNFGPLTVHLDGCSHIPKMKASGGGILFDADTLEAAKRLARDEADGRAPKVARCAKEV